MTAKKDITFRKQKGDKAAPVQPVEKSGSEPKAQPDLPKRITQEAPPSVDLSKVLPTHKLLPKLKLN